MTPALLAKVDFWGGVVLGAIVWLAGMVQL